MVRVEGSTCAASCMAAVLSLPILTSNQTVLPRSRRLPYSSAASSLAPELRWWKHMLRLVTNLCESMKIVVRLVGCHTWV